MNYEELLKQQLDNTVNPEWVKDIIKSLAEKDDIEIMATLSALIHIFGLKIPDLLVKIVKVSLVKDAIATAAEMPECDDENCACKIQH